MRRTSRWSWFVPARSTRRSAPTPSRAKGLAGDDTPDPKAQSVREVAEITVRAVERGAAVVETSAAVASATTAARLVPSLVRWALSRRARSSTPS